MAKKTYRKKGGKCNNRTVKCVKKIVKAELKKEVELKYHELGLNGVDTNGQPNNALEAYYCLTNIAQALTDVGRIGDKINVKSIRIRGVVQTFPNPGNNNNALLFKLCVFQYHDVVDGTVATINAQLPITQVFYPGWDTLNVGPDSFTNMDRRTQFTVLYEKLFKVTNVIDNIPGMHVLNFKVPLKYAKRHTEYISGSTTQAANHYFLVVLDQSNQTTNPGRLFASARVTYTDA